MSRDSIVTLPSNSGDGTHAPITGTESAGDKRALDTVSLSDLIKVPYDHFTLTYVTTGNGVGEISTMTLIENSITVGVLTLTYDSSNRLIDGVMT